MPIFLNSITNWLESHMLPCLFKTITGYECPGCGIQRSLVALFKGNIAESFMLYPATIPLLLLIIFGIYSSKKEVKHSAKIIKIGYIIVVGFVIISYIIKHVIKHNVI